MIDESDTSVAMTTPGLSISCMCLSSCTTCACLKIKFTAMSNEIHHYHNKRSVYRQSEWGKGQMTWSKIQMHVPVSGSRGRVYDSKISSSMRYTLNRTALSIQVTTANAFKD